MQSLVLFFETTFLVDCLRVKGLQEQVIDLLFLRLTNNFILLKPDIAFKLIDFNQKGGGNMLLFLSVIIWKLTFLGRKEKTLNLPRTLFHALLGEKKKQGKLEIALDRVYKMEWPKAFWRVAYLLKSSSMMYCVLREKKHCSQSEQFQVKNEVLIDEIVPLLYWWNQAK